MALKDVLKRMANKTEEDSEGKFDEECAFCGNKATEVKWMGQYFHKKCKRKAKRFAKGMV